MAGWQLDSSSDTSPLQPSHLWRDLAGKDLSEIGKGEQPQRLPRDREMESRQPSRQPSATSLDSPLNPKGREAYSDREVWEAREAAEGQREAEETPSLQPSAASLAAHSSLQSPEVPCRAVSQRATWGQPVRLQRDKEMGNT